MPQKGSILPPRLDVLPDPDAQDPRILPRKEVTVRLAWVGGAGQGNLGLLARLPEQLDGRGHEEEAQGLCRATYHRH